MTDWMSPQEAMAYLGLGPEDLTRIIQEKDVDVQLDKQGLVLAVDAADLREPLFEEHEKKHGYRPDDPERVAKAQKNKEDQEKMEKEARKAKRVQLAKRISVPHE